MSKCPRLLSFIDAFVTDVYWSFNSHMYTDHKPKPKAQRTKSSRSEGLPMRSLARRAPKTSSKLNNKHCIPKQRSCNRRCCKGSQSASEKKNGWNPSGHVHPLGRPGEGRSKLPGYQEANEGCSWVEASIVEGSGCIEEECSHENSQSGRHNETGRSEAGGKGDASQSPKHEAPAVEGVGEGGHGGREGQWAAEGPTRVAKRENYSNVLWPLWY